MSLQALYKYRVGQGGHRWRAVLKELALIGVSATATCTEADGESTTTRQGFQYLYTPLLIANESPLNRLLGLVATVLYNGEHQGVAFLVEAETVI